jgi:hypothetical protein
MTWEITDARGRNTGLFFEKFGKIAAQFQEVCAKVGRPKPRIPSQIPGFIDPRPHFP